MMMTMPMQNKISMYHFQDQLLTDNYKIIIIKNGGKEKKKKIDYELKIQQKISSI